MGFAVDAPVEAIGESDSAVATIPVSELRVLHGSPNWLPLTQTWMHTQLMRLPESIESHVVCGTVENLDQFPVPHMHCLSSSRLRWHIDRLARAAGLRRELGHLLPVARRVDARVLHSHFGHVGWQNSAAAHRAGLAHVVTFYGQDASLMPRREPVWRERYVEMFDQVDRVLAEGRHFAGTIEALGCPREKIEVHHLGVEFERLPFVARDPGDGRPLRVLMAGTFTEKKGIPYAIEALTALRDGGCAVDVTLIGDASDDPRLQREKRRIEDSVARGGLAVRQLGFQPHAALIEAAYEHDVFLSPSVVAEDGDSEGGAPVTILEMAATGLPVVSTRHCDIPEVLGAAGEPLLAAERDVDGLVSRLRRVAEDREFAAAIVAGVRAHLETEYDANTQGERLASIYRRALATREG